MARNNQAGIRKRHTSKCPAKGNRKGRCRCDGPWQAYVYSAKDGKPIYRTFKLLSEARSWRADAKRALDLGTLRAPSADDLKLGEAIELFIERMKSGRSRPKGKDAYKPNTIRSYERAYNLHIKPAPIASARVTEIRRRNIQELVDDLLAEGLSSGTVSNILNPIQAYYREAIDREELAVNPSTGINITYGRSSRPSRIASPDEAEDLIDALPVEDQAMWATAFYAGLRRGELQALKVQNIDFKTGLIWVEQGWDMVEGEIEPKSTSSRRKVPILTVLRDHLEEHLRRTGRQGRTLVFGRPDGRPFDPGTVNKRAERAWKRRNERETELAKEENRQPSLVEPITMHECRHTFASILIDAGANPKSIQTYMGHSKITTTFDTYGHLMPGDADEVRKLTDDYLKKVKKKRRNGNGGTGG